MARGWLEHAGEQVYYHMREAQLGRDAVVATDDVADGALWREAGVCLNSASLTNQETSDPSAALHFAWFVLVNLLLAC